MTSDSRSAKRTGRPTRRKTFRKLRREVYFGCPLCGNPLLTYHHIVPWHEENHMRDEDMIALCQNHARMADSGAISRSKLYNLKANPPRKRKIRDRFEIDNWGDFTIAVANSSVLFQNCTTVLRVQGQPVLGFTRQFKMPALFLHMQDDAGQTLLEIEENDWVVNVDGIWDCEVKGSRITVRDSSRRYYVSYHVDAEKALVSVDFSIHSHGVDFVANKSGLALGGIRYSFQNFLFRNCSVAFDLFKCENGKWKGRMAVP